MVDTLYIGLKINKCTIGAMLKTFFSVLLGGNIRFNRVTLSVILYFQPHNDYSKNFQFLINLTGNIIDQGCPLKNTIIT